jgi:hypothetical protein
MYREERGKELEIKCLQVCARRCLGNNADARTLNLTTTVSRANSKREKRRKDVVKPRFMPVFC